MPFFSTMIFADRPGFRQCRAKRRLTAAALFLLLISGCLHRSVHLSRTAAPLIIAHRGASGLAPENTRAAVILALELGADMIEIDVRLTADSQAVCLHDRTVDRTTDGSGPVSNFTLDELRALDAGSWFSTDYAGEKIPSLDEVLTAVAGRARLLIEIKTHRGESPAIADRVLAVIRSRGAAAWCEIQSFEDRVLEYIAAAAPEIQLHKLLIADIPLLPLLVDNGLHCGRLADYRSYAALNLFHGFVCRDIIDRARRLGLRVHVWTVNDSASIARQFRLGADGVITDFPHRHLPRPRK